MPRPHTIDEPPLHTQFYDVDGNVSHAWTMWLDSLRTVRPRRVVTTTPATTNDCKPGELIVWDHDGVVGLVYNDGTAKWYFTGSNTPF